jgi:hypothetical protein
LAVLFFVDLFFFYADFFVDAFLALFLVDAGLAQQAALGGHTQAGVLHSAVQTTAFLTDFFTDFLIFFEVVRFLVPFFETLFETFPLAKFTRKYMI